MDEVVVGIVGLGYWGPNLLRNFSQIEQCKVKVCCDLDEEILASIKKQYNYMETTNSYSYLIEDSEIDAIIIATSAATHYSLAKQAILNGKNVFVEKPLSLEVSHAEELALMAEKHNVKLMVGHLMMYHPAVEMLKDMIKNSELGDIYYIYSQRVNLGLVRNDTNALWDFGPHDVSIIIYLLGIEPEIVSAKGRAYLQDNIEDVVFLNLQFSNKVMAQIQLSWLDPHKVRRTVIVGSRKMVVFDDMEPTEMIRIYDRGVNIQDYNSFGESLSLRFGDIRTPYIKMKEPLRIECQHFIDCINMNLEPKSDGWNGLQVVKVLTAAQESLNNGGISVNKYDIFREAFIKMDNKG